MYWTLIRTLENSLRGEQFGNFRNRFETSWELDGSTEGHWEQNKSKQPHLPQKEKTWAPWFILPASPHWLQEFVLPTVFFAIFGLGYWQGHELRVYVYILGSTAKSDALFNFVPQSPWKMGKGSTPKSLYFSLSLVNMFSLPESCTSISTPTPANIPFH